MWPIDGMGRHGLRRRLWSSVWEVVGEVGVAGSWRSDDDDTVWQPRRGSLCVSVFRVGSQVSCGGVPNALMFYNDIGALYEFSASSESVNSLFFLIK
jgi:hypothetical protein